MCNNDSFALVRIVSAKRRPPPILSRPLRGMDPVHILVERSGPDSDDDEEDEPYAMEMPPSSAFAGEISDCWIFCN